MEQWNITTTTRKELNKINDLQAKNPVPVRWNIWNIWNKGWNKLIYEHLLTCLPASSSTSSSSTGTITKSRANKKPPKGFGLLMH